MKTEIIEDFGKPDFQYSGTSKIIVKAILFVCLVLFASYAFFIGLLLNYFPVIVKERIKQGNDIPYFPLIVGSIIIGLAILCLFIEKLSARSPNRPSKFRWLWLIFAEIVLITGLSLALFSIFKFVL
jgi:hypothetical protein